MANTWPFIKLGASIIAFTLAAYWTFWAGSPPKTTMEASILWMAPQMISAIISIPLWIFQANGHDAAEEKSLQTSRIEASIRRQYNTLNFAATAWTSGALFIVICQTCWTVSMGIFSDLKPYDPDGTEDANNKGRWGISIFAAFLVLGFSGFFIFVAFIPTFLWYKRWSTWRDTTNLDTLQMESLSGDSEKESECPDTG